MLAPRRPTARPPRRRLPARRRRRVLAAPAGAPHSRQRCPAGRPFWAGAGGGGWRQATAVAAVAAGGGSDVKPADGAALLPAAIWRGGAGLAGYGRVWSGQAGLAGLAIMQGPRAGSGQEPGDLAALLERLQGFKGRAAGRARVISSSTKLQLTWAPSPLLQLAYTRSRQFALPGAQPHLLPRRPDQSDCWFQAWQPPAARGAAIGESSEPHSHAGRRVRRRVREGCDGSRSGPQLAPHCGSQHA